eukprot:TRINITY_DN1216_c0_g1_i1.p1 TRINITY_DN1216_c0_g1~~TRINITY_DN1216_c0_g1_i1.p1  ORF type:complete len:666 (+),score=126.37 TRINITY_DN1216_c0_g1_i1:69-2066(+)
MNNHPPYCRLPDQMGTAGQQYVRNDWQGHHSPFQGAFRGAAKSARMAPMANYSPNVSQRAIGGPVMPMQTFQLRQNFHTATPTSMPQYWPTAANLPQVAQYAPSPVAPPVMQTAGQQVSAPAAVPPIASAFQTTIHQPTFQQAQPQMVQPNLQQATHQQTTSLKRNPSLPQINRLPPTLNRNPSNDRMSQAATPQGPLERRTTLCGPIMNISPVVGQGYTRLTSALPNFPPASVSNHQTLDERRENAQIVGQDWQEKNAVSVQNVVSSSDKLVQTPSRVRIPKAESDTESRFSFLCSEEKGDRARSPLSKLREKRSSSIQRQHQCVQEEQDISFGRERQPISIEDFNEIYFEDGRGNVFEEEDCDFEIPRRWQESPGLKGKQTPAPNVMYIRSPRQAEIVNFFSSKSVKAEIIKGKEAKAGPTSASAEDIVKITIETNAREDNPILIEIQKIFSNLKQELGTSGKKRPGSGKGQSSAGKIYQQANEPAKLRMSGIKVNGSPMEDMTIHELSSISNAQGESGIKLRVSGIHDEQRAEPEITSARPPKHDKQKSDNYLRESARDTRQLEYDTFQKRSSRASHGILSHRESMTESEVRGGVSQLNKENIYKELEMLQRLTRRFVESGLDHRDSARGSLHNEVKMEAANTGQGTLNTARSSHFTLNNNK